ncbi:hypothetical protein NDU88_006552 [Pleurodeles waltl]|uniref:Uncharacterized protein n=1 Tax=Pleurodeles waltl TaxID=8319 RepID=A0AAV7TZT9_PLEWA|nr:hypothetical protein NDU88_006552 [Pleurodeles waltl]
MARAMGSLQLWHTPQQAGRGAGAWEGLRALAGCRSAHNLAPQQQKEGKRPSASRQHEDSAAGVGDWGAGMGFPIHDCGETEVKVNRR